MKKIFLFLIIGVAAIAGSAWLYFKHPSWTTATSTSMVVSATSHRATTSTIPSVATAVEAVTSTATPPVQTSASVHDALTEQGWTVTGDRAINDTMPVAGDLSGTRRTHQFTASRTNSNIQPFITQFQITDPAALLQSAIGLQNQKKSVSLRNGYLLTIPGEVPSSAFVLIGKSSVLFIQFSLKGTGNPVLWTEHDPAPELADLIQKLPL